MRRGRLVVLEGWEGSGKTTILNRLRDIADPDKMILTREPGGSEMAEQIRNLIFSEGGKSLSPDAQFHLFWAARADHIDKKILPALSQGVDVVSDRFDASTFAYQIFGEEHHRLKNSFRFNREEMFAGRIVPTYIYLDIDPEVGLLRRRGAKDGNHFDEKNIEFHRRVRQGYREFIQFARVVEIDASGSAEEVWNAFYEKLLEELSR